ncbi:hypothetical protein POM88_039280 [Heracleum sosnowskyi]|uniref:MYB transcription factor n=1 Tax=Heracleum sosnowskyi TaxID=360622 RepID=A0AAD8HCE2_9APIA|nr:hypothetical protein POM88_039280 [Heracleum sosnowskyi]
MGPCKIKWTAEEEAAMRAGVVKHGASKWRVILKDPEFKNVLCARSNIDLKDKWRNMQLTMNGQSRNRYKPVLKKIEKTSRSCDKSVALTSEGSDEDTIVELEPPSSFNEASQEGGSEKLTRFSLEDIKTVPVDGKLVEVKQGMEYDSAYSNILRNEINVELMRIGLMSPADAAAAAVAAVKKAEAAIAEAEEAEKEAVEAERVAEEAKAFAEKLKKELSEKKARPGYAASRRGKHWWQ